MTDIDDLVYQRLAADGTLTGILTGGVRYWDTLPGEGVTVRSVPAAFDNDGFLKPLGIVKGRGVVPGTGIRDREAQLTSVQQVVEIWLYNDKDAGYVTLKLARDRIYTLLHEKPVTGAWSLTLDQELKLPRAAELGDAVTMRLDYLAIAYKGTLV
jgi:hypothetical protein